METTIISCHTYVHMNSSHNTYNLHTIIIYNFSIFHHFQQGYLAIILWTCLVQMTDGSERSSSWNMVNKATNFLFVIPNKEQGICTKWKWRMLLSFCILLTHHQTKAFHIYFVKKCWLSKNRKLMDYINYTYGSYYLLRNFIVILYGQWIYCSTIF